MNLALRELRDARVEAATQAVKRVVAAQADSLPDRIDELAVAAASGCTSSFVRMAHNLSGEAGYIGADALADLAGLSREIAERVDEARARSAMLVAVNALRLSAEQWLRGDPSAVPVLRAQLTELLNALPEAA